ncbi:MAG: capsular polysaccharide biosynthesis protein CapF [Rikenellaceae bacterium]|nr:capsular polysaccharide biosynthesis protein CapF [Rikenellaceae bacterium]
MRILVTGARGFVGRNLCAELGNIREGKDRSFGDLKIDEIFEFDVDSDPGLLEEYCQRADFVFNLAGVNRPKEQSEFMEGNFGFAEVLLDTLKKYKNSSPVMISSSTQAELDNPYGQSKRAGEELMFRYSRETGAKVLVYRFPNLFGKWCRPNYNSAVATFCHNIANDLPIAVSNRDNSLTLVYIDDLINEMVGALKGQEHREGSYCYVPEVYNVTLGEIVDLLFSFREGRKTLEVPDMGNPFTKKLYATYLSYLPEDQFSYPLKMNVDERGSFTEIIRTPERGQFSVNISKPHITKGNHWHHTKCEKFIVISGKGAIRFRKIGEPEAEVIEYIVSGEKIEVVDIPAGYTHNIENMGDTDMVTLMWANEKFYPARPDTFFESV